MPELLRVKGQRFFSRCRGPEVGNAEDVLCCNRLN